MNSQNRKNSISPLISIVIPVFNRQKGLDALLLDIQTAYNNFLNGDISVEVIVIDDASKKPIFFEKFSYIIKLERNTKNLGAPLSRKKGFELSKGQFVHFHDSDDSIDENWLSDIVSELRKTPDLDILMTGRVDVNNSNEIKRNQAYFHKQVLNPLKIQSRLVYRNCMGPLGGVTFPRRVLEQVEFKPFSSCQDWQMYIDALKHAKVLASRPDIKFIFNKTGDDRISDNPRKKILGHLQLAKITAEQSPFGNNIRLFYLYTCKQHIFNKGGAVLRFYKKNRFKILFNYFLISLYWRLT